MDRITSLPFVHSATLSYSLAGTFQVSFTSGKSFASRLRDETDSPPANSQALHADVTWLIYNVPEAPIKLRFPPPMRSCSSVATTKLVETAWYPCRGEYLNHCYAH